MSKNEMIETIPKLPLVAPTIQRQTVWYPYHVSTLTRSITSIHNKWERIHYVIFKTVLSYRVRCCPYWEEAGVYRYGTIPWISPQSHKKPLLFFIKVEFATYSRAKTAFSALNTSYIIPSCKKEETPYRCS